MSFDVILRKIVEECGGGIGVALMGNDGIPIEQIDLTDFGADSPVEDIATVGAELGRVLDEARKASDSLAAGLVEEAIFTFSAFTLIVRGIDDETSIALAIEPGGNLGKARFLIRRNVLALRELL